MEQEELAPAAAADCLPSLAQCCVLALAGMRDYIGNLPYEVLPGQVRRILATATRTQLQSIEDLTSEGGGRELTWYTWHLWQRIYQQLFGLPPADGLIDLPGEPPLDYEPPAGVKAPPADYRTMVETKEAAAAARLAAAQQRLRKNYNQAGKERQNHGVEYTNKLPPAKRSRLVAAAAAGQRQQAAGGSGGGGGGGSSRMFGGRPATKVIKDLGLAPGRKPRSNISGSTIGSRQHLEHKRQAQAQLLQQKQKQQRLSGPVATLGSHRSAAAAGAAALKKTTGSSGSGLLGRPATLVAQQQSAGQRQRQQQLQQNATGSSLGSSAGRAVSAMSSATAGRAVPAISTATVSTQASKTASPLCQQRQLEAAAQRKQKSTASSGAGLLDSAVMLSGRR